MMLFTLVCHSSAAGVARSCAMHSAACEAIPFNRVFLLFNLHYSEALLSFHQEPVYFASSN